VFESSFLENHVAGAYNTLALRHIMEKVMSICNTQAEQLRITESIGAKILPKQEEAQFLFALGLSSSVEDIYSTLLSQNVESKANTDASKPSYRFGQGGQG
ncbi:hypothetical protein HK096_001985, partial [Nowakowskiella sp. JEL0078]